MLPTLLPDTVCVFFDLQGHPVDTAAGFTRWIGALEQAVGDRRLLICLDEFETLERSFPGSRQDLLKLMGLFQATIQHRHAASGC